MSAYMIFTSFCWTRLCFRFNTGVGQVCNITMLQNMNGGSTLPALTKHCTFFFICNILFIRLHCGGTSLLEICLKGREGSRLTTV